MRVALVHDDLVQWGGAERVLLGISEIFPDAPIFTSVIDTSNKILAEKLRHKNIKTSFLQKIPGWKNLYKAMLPLYPIAFEQFDFSGYDLVISQTTRFAKAVITKPNTLHICYCHTPPRFLWNNPGKPHPILDFYLSKLREYDFVTAKRVDYYIAGSANAKKRIKKNYGINSKVIYPFVDLDRYKGIETFDGEFFLVVSRLNKYKGIDKAIEACSILNLPLKIVGIGPEMNNLKKLCLRTGRENIEFLGFLNDNELDNVMAGCRALIIPGIEDFGLVSLEAQALGKPVIAFKKGGVLETILEGKSGIFFENQNTLLEILRKISIKNFGTYMAKDCRENADKFGKAIFNSRFKKKIYSLLY
jgi:glycosyltransferase involved in cell wall biosynthesis